MPNDKEIRKIVQDEIRKSNNLRRFGFQEIPNHVHDGEDAPRIKEENVVPGASVTGSITMAGTGDYIIQLSAIGTPRTITAYGIVVGTDGGQTVRCLSMGSAQLTPTFYLQPGGDSFVVTGDLQFPFQGKPAQSSTYLSVDATPEFHALVSEDHICSIFYNSTVWARATVTDFGKSSVTINVPFLESGWQIILNYVIT